MFTLTSTGQRFDTPKEVVKAAWDKYGSKEGVDKVKKFFSTLIIPIDGKYPGLMMRELESSTPDADFEKCYNDWCEEQMAEQIQNLEEFGYVWFYGFDVIISDELMEELNNRGIKY